MKNWIFFVHKLIICHRIFCCKCIYCALLPCAYNEGIIMERNKNNFGDLHNSTVEEFLSFL